MRVLISCLQSLRRHDIPACDFWREYFIEGCREAGVEPLEVPGVDWAEGLTYSEGTGELESWKSRTWGKTLSFAREEHSRGGVDLFLGYLYPQQVEVAAIKEMQRAGIPCVNFFCDNVREFRKLPGVYTTFDLHWVPEYEALSMYRRAGLPCLHAAMPCWVPPRFRDMPAQETEPPTFIGSADILRRQLLSHALALGAELTLRGPGWGKTENMQPGGAQGRYRQGPLQNQLATISRHGVGAIWAKIINKLLPVELPDISRDAISPAVFGDEYFRVTREARTTIGVNRVPVARRSLRKPLAYSRLRDIEAPMLGACYLTEQTSGIEHLYELGKEIETYRTAAELADKLNQLLADAPRRMRLRLAGQSRALSEHTVAATLAKIGLRLGVPLKP